MPSIIPPDLESLRTTHRDLILATYLVGSRAYGTATPESDEDYRGIFVLPQRAYLSIHEPIKQIADERSDITFYTLKRFLELASTANPNIIEMLFMPPDCRVFESPLMQPLLDNRNIFITKQAYTSHVNYAVAQIRRARGQNKWINNPQPEQNPTELDFCWFVPRENYWTAPGTAGVSPASRSEKTSMQTVSNRTLAGGVILAQAGTALPGYPYRPIPLKETDIDLSFCACASMEQLSNAYRLYRYENPTRGVFRNSMLVCESIPKGDENTRCIGLLIYNRGAHEKALRDHANYWQWRNHRNEARWESQQRGENDYDAKNMMHTFRLLLSGEHILRHGTPIVRFEGELLQTLLEIRAGKSSYEDLIHRVDAKLEELDKAFRNSKLPETSDTTIIDKLLSEITIDWENEHEK